MVVGCDPGVRIGIGLLTLTLCVGLAARPQKEMKGETKGKDDKEESGNRDKGGRDDRGGKKGGSSGKK